MSVSKRTWGILAVLVAAVVGTVQAHDMFLKLPSFYLEPNETADVWLFNGDFTRSENVIARDRMADVSLMGPGRLTHPPESAWTDVSMTYEDSLDTSQLEIRTGEAGTYVLGVSTTETVFTLTARDFNDYLVHDGVVDILARRERQGQMGDEATERYSKHVKAILQVGSDLSDEFERPLGYPAEFIPLRNPYEIRVGQELEVQFLFDGRPVPNQPVYASHEAYHGHDDAGGHLEAVSTRTDGYGIARIPIDHSGQWYVRTIHMRETTDEADVDYESDWATLTFQIR